jgi:glycosyltransferase involved in cell wall biosynthesis
MTYLVARLKRRPFILWTGIWVRLQTSVHRFLYPLTRYIYRHADAVIVYGDHTRNFLIKEGVVPERIFVAAHAVDNNMYNRQVSPVERDNFRETLGIGVNQRIILYLGRLEEVKGLPYLLEAFAVLKQDPRFNRHVLVLAGTGTYEKVIQEFVIKYNLQDSVYLPGYVNVEQAVRYYASADCFVLPSITLPQGRELWGLVINEAFNQGMPVITTDAVGAAAGGLVQDNFNGFIVPERDSRALAAALEKLFVTPGLIEQFGRNARETIASWDNERMVLGFRQALQYVLGKNRRSVKAPVIRDNSL